MSGGPREGGSGLTRRQFVRLGAAAGGGIVVALYVPGCGGEPASTTPGPTVLAGGRAPATAAPAVFEPNAWVRIHPDDSATITVAKSEMGQGVRTTLALLVAEELDLDWDRVRVEQAPADEKRYGSQGTGGSSSVLNAWEPVRTAAAGARAVLVAAAAARLGVDARELETRDGRVRHPTSDRTLSYAELGEDAARIPVPADAKPKARKEWRLLGRRRIIGVDALDIVTGRAEYGSDVRWPGMLYAAVARTPAHGGDVRSYDASAALRVPGVRKVVRVRGDAGSHVHPGVAVVGDSSWAAIRGRDALQVKWEPGPHGSDTSESFSTAMRRAVSGPGSATVLRTGDPDTLIREAVPTDVVTATYELPFLSHATMEPQTSVAEVDGRTVRLLSPTQFPGAAVAATARVLGVDPSTVELTIPLLGGGYGRRINADYAVEAALIAREVGAPVKVVWTREDDLGHDFYRPAAVHRFDAVLGEDGYPTAWRHRFSTPAISGTYESTVDAAAWGRSEGAGTVNMLYGVPNRSEEYSYLPCGLHRGWWRAVSTTHGIFARECFIDELAARAGLDPVEYRLRLLTDSPATPPASDPRSPPDPVKLRGVLSRAAREAGWGRALPDGHAMGVACGIDHLGYAAEVVEVSRHADGFRIERVVAALDVGPVVNPDGGRAQVEGAIHQGLSAALGERVTVRDGAVEQGNFDRYPILRIDRAPRRVDVHFIETDRHPTGLGEPGLPPAAPALANALARLTGRRIRSLPIEGGTPEAGDTPTVTAVS